VSIYNDLYNIYIIHKQVWFTRFIYLR